LIDSSLVRKIEKAKDYAVQPDRVTLRQCAMQFRGDNSDHEIAYEAGKWKCNCDYFVSGHGTCSHIMAVQLMMKDLAPA
jgi:hypothetical protein